jgi:hypothetical protein
LLNIGDGWAIARLKTPRLETLCDFRIKNDRALLVGQLENGVLTLTVDNKLMGRSTGSPDLKVDPAHTAGTK